LEALKLEKLGFRNGFPLFIVLDPAVLAQPLKELQNLGLIAGAEAIVELKSRAGLVEANGEFDIRRGARVGDV